MSHQNREKINFQKIALTSIAVVGVVGVVVLAPNILQVARQFSGNKKYNRRDYVNRAIQNLIKKDLVTLEIKDDKRFVRLTKKGEEQLTKYQLGDIKINKPKKWDKKWRMIIFDIKEKRRITRDLLRDTLNRLGFIKLQNSVWVFPYECEELIAMLKSDLFVGKDVLYITADKIENEGWLKKSFGLT